MGESVDLAAVGAQVASPQSPLLRFSTALLPANPRAPEERPLVPSHFSAFVRTVLSGFVRTTTATILLLASGILGGARFRKSAGSRRYIN